MSTTTIDHAIAIPTSQYRVWSVLSDLNNNPVWQADSDAVAFLSTMHEGRGTRWRNTSANGREYVLEISAWYEGLGYEYLIVDGLSIQNGRGRIRLQETAEGTIVQWTFSYDLQGFLSGMRNSLGVKRSFDHDIVDSLQNLYSYIRSLVPENAYDPNDLRSMMRDAPSVEERTSYQSRELVSAVKAEVETPAPEILTDEDRFKPPVSASPVLIKEPPLSDDDTKPNKAVQEQFAPATDRDRVPDTLDEPAFLRDIPDYKPTDAVALPEAQPTPPDESPAKIDDEIVTSQTESLSQETDPAPESRPVAQPLAYDEGEVGKLDTARISVFEVFGLQKPSESELVRALTDEDIARMTAPKLAEEVTSSPPPPTPAAAIPSVTTTATIETRSIAPDVLPDDSAIRRQRIGLRVRLRNHRINVRRPK